MGGASVAIVKLDEDLAPISAAPLQAAGHEVRSVLTQGWSGIADNELLQRVTAEGAMLVTADKGFGDIRKYPPGSHGGIILLRPDNESLGEYRELLALLVARHELEALAGAVTVVTSRSVRTRRRG